MKSETGFGRKRAVTLLWPNSTAAVVRHVADQLNKTFVQDSHKLTQPLQHLQHRNRVANTYLVTFQFPTIIPNEVARINHDLAASASVGSDRILLK